MTTFDMQTEMTLKHFRLPLHQENDNVSCCKTIGRRDIDGKGGKGGGGKGLNLKLRLRVRPKFWFLWWWI